MESVSAAVSSDRYEHPDVLSIKCLSMDPENPSSRISFLVVIPLATLEAITSLALGAMLTVAGVLSLIPLVPLSCCCCCCCLKISSKITGLGIDLIGRGFESTYAALSCTVGILMPRSATRLLND